MKVTLVGAGVGEAGLLSVRALRRIRGAGVLVYDRLLNPALLEEAPAGCERIDVGKRAGQHTMPQAEINALLLRKAREGQNVVRLKGGDPYVFGRGGEEALFLRENGVEVEVVPGISSAVGGLCYAGIPVTHRGLASSFHVIAGNRGSLTLEDIDWETLARLEGTLVFLMGLQNLPFIVSSLLRCGKDMDTPAAVVSRAACFDQRVIVSTLAGLPDAAADAPSPAVIVVGEVVRLREELCFFERLPLFGQSVALTRPGPDPALRVRLEEAGARVLDVPLTETCPLPVEAGALAREARACTHLIFTSARAVDLFFDRLDEAGADARALGGAFASAVGPATEQALRRRGVRADLAPSRPGSGGLAAALESILTPSDRVLYPRARETAGDLAGRLRQICPVVEFELYETRPLAQNAARLARLMERGEVTAAVFYSPSAARCLLESPAGRAAAQRAALFAVGPVTAARVRAPGLPCREAGRPDGESVAREIIDYFEKERAQ